MENKILVNCIEIDYLHVLKNFDIFFIYFEIITRDETRKDKITCMSLRVLGDLR